MDDMTAVDPAAEDWFTADFLEFAGSLAAQTVTEPAEDGFEGMSSGLGKAADATEVAYGRDQ